jgi:hypothetical protein
VLVYIGGGLALLEPGSSQGDRILVLIAALACGAVFLAMLRVERGLRTPLSGGPESR